METTWALYYWLYVSLARIAMAVGVITATVLTVFAAIAFFVLFIGLMDDDEDAWKDGLSLLKRVLLGALLLTPLAFIPDRQDAKTILALIGVETAVKSVRDGRLAEKSLRIIERQLDKLDTPDKGEGE